MIDKLLKSVPLISGVLIFFGFLNYHFYYNCFEIEITNYLTTGELLLSFLQLTVPIIIILAVVFAYIYFHLMGWIIAPSIINTSEDEDDSDSNIFAHDQIKYFVKNIKRFNYKQSKFYVFGISGIVAVLKKAGETIFFIGYPPIIFLHIVNQLPFNLGIIVVIITSTLWIITFISILNRLETKRETKYSNTKIIFIIALTISIIYISRKETADLILSGNSTIEAKAYFQNDTIETNSNIRFIGKTDRYIFFRSISDSTNLIYSTNNLIKLEKKK